MLKESIQKRTPLQAPKVYNKDKKTHFQNSAGNKRKENGFESQICFEIIQEWVSRPTIGSNCTWEGIVLLVADFVA